MVSGAGNGVILITTKKGTKREGLGITIRFQFLLRQHLCSLKRQKTFGQGENGVFDSTNGYSWGLEEQGKAYTKWDGTTANMQIFDNVKNFFDTGVNLSESISFQQQYDKTSIYTLLNRMDDSSMIPGANLSRNKLNFACIFYFW